MRTSAPSVRQCDHFLRIIKIVFLFIEAYHLLETTVQLRKRRSFSCPSQRLSSEAPRRIYNVSQEW